MPDRLSTEIWIGGDIPESLVPELCELIRTEEAALDWGKRSFQPRTARDLQVAAPKDEPLRLCDERAAGGCFQELERFLEENRIAFRRRCEGRYECEPQMVEYRPGYELVELETNAGGYPVVLALDLIPVKHLLEAALEAADDQPDSRTLSLLQTALKTLREQMPPELPPLEPFQVVPDADSDSICMAVVGDKSVGNEGQSQPVAATRLPKWIAQMDWTMLREQKQWLADQASAHPDQAEGLLSLLDALQDHAVDELGLPEEVVLPGLKTCINEERAARAERALTAYGTAADPDRDDVLTDLLTDLRHYCQQHHMDWDGALEIVAMHFKDERAGT
jgi:hypothetical protein